MSMSIFSYTQIAAGFQAGLSFHQFQNYHKKENIPPSDEQNDLFKHGIYVALPIVYKINNQFSVQGELSFAHKGHKIIIRSNSVPISQNGDYINIEYRLDYFEIPILIKRFIPIKNKGFNIGMGISMGYLLNGKRLYFDSTQPTSEGIFPLNLSNNFNTSGYKYNRWDASYLIDLSLPTITRYGTFVFGTRSSLDITSWLIYEEQNSTNPDIHNWGIMIYGGYIIPDKM